MILMETKFKMKNILVRIRLNNSTFDFEELLEKDTEELEWFCGYVQIPKKFTYNISNIEVHGGITYKKQEKDGYTWIGFDTMHFGDDLNKCNFKYVFNELKKIIDYLIKNNGDIVN